MTNIANVSDGAEKMSGSYVNPVDPMKRPTETQSAEVAKRMKKVLICNARTIFAQDWLILIALGVSVAVLSLCMDMLIDKLTEGPQSCPSHLPNLTMPEVIVRIWLYSRAMLVSVGAGISTWIILMAGMTLASALVSHYISPQAIGSGIPEMKTVLRGIVLKEYLTFPALVSKVIGLTIAISSGLPIGKEGPMVHIGSIVAALICKAFGYLFSANENHNRHVEMVAAGCAVGVACTFGAPIGGVLFSIEVTSVHFALRNYWRGFFSAVFSALMFTIFGMLRHQRETLAAFCPTSFSLDIPLKGKELVCYALLGIICGLCGAGFVVWYKIVCEFISTNKYVKKINEHCRYVYPVVVSVVVAGMTLPNYGGTLVRSTIPSNEALSELFSNFTWSHPNSSDYDHALVASWSPGSFSIYLTLLIFLVYHFFISAICISLPIPSGMFTPALLAGASIGRLMGECLARWLPVDQRHEVVAGSYAVVGAAALTGAVTQTVSTAMILFELTGQIVYMVPTLLGVALANLISVYLYPSIYDIGIYIKKLPYLPNLLPTSFAVHKIYVRDFMTTGFKYLTLSSTYKDIQELLVSEKQTRKFPLVENSKTMILIGEISRAELNISLSSQLTMRSNVDRRRQRWKQRKCFELSLGFKDAKLDEKTVGNTSVRSTPTVQRREGRTLQRSIFICKNQSRRKMIKYNLRKTAKKWLRKTHGSRRNKSACSNELKDDNTSRLNNHPDYATMAIDSAPFQLVENCSLFKAHAIFSSLCTDRAYVTSRGRLIGLVTLDKLCKAVEQVRHFSRPRIGDGGTFPNTWVCDNNDPSNVYTNVTKSSKSESGEKSIHFSLRSRDKMTDRIKRFSIPVNAFSLQRRPSFAPEQSCSPNAENAV